jgi:hypothetical protein
MGKRGPKPSGRVKTLVSLRPDQLSKLRIIAGHRASAEGTPADVSTVLRDVIDQSSLVREAHRDAMAAFITANRSVDGMQAVATALHEARRAGAEGEEAERAMFDAALARQDGHRELVRALISHANLTPDELTQFVVNVIRARQAEARGTWSGLEPSDPMALIRPLPESAFKPLPKSESHPQQKKKRKVRKP